MSEGATACFSRQDQWSKQYCSNACSLQRERKVHNTKRSDPLWSNCVIDLFTDSFNLRKKTVLFSEIFLWEYILGA